MFSLYEQLTRPMGTHKNSSGVFHRIDDAFENYFANMAKPSHPGNTLRELDTEFVLTLDAPGFEVNEFDIVADEENVTVKAEHSVTEGETTRTERSLHRQFTLPSFIDPNKVEAKYRNGVLELRLAKAAPTSRKIDVKLA
ncbi:MAG: Hsp20/alpha crystallin family protein [Planctomycetes bacterium]|nr:Hsp20/alpha crystallin family protein [Planctomycetota bacterium]